MNFLSLFNDIDTTPWIPPKVAIQIGSFEIAWYGIFIFIGFALAIVLVCIKLAKWYKIPYDPFFYFCFVGVPVSILGARLWSFIIGDAKVSTNFFVDFWAFHNGGLAIQGAVFFTVLAGLIWFPLILRRSKYRVKTQLQNQFYIKQISTWVYADAIIPCVLIGQVIGRWGNFFNQELYGPIADPTNMQWLKYLMPGVYHGMFINGEMRQPFFLYESFVNFWFFLALYVGGEFIKKRKAGDLAICYFLFYGLLRICMEPFRAAQFEFATTIVTSSLFIFFSIVFILLNHLVFSKKRDFKFLYWLWVNFSWPFKLLWAQMNKSYNNKLNRKDSLHKNFGYTKRPIFKKEQSEMLYYNGL
ncbi:MAG: prolipoprotein diacylglyceryl transferase [Malacoplasma sp.]|nr:prolipoprotein diacylglyceryl transferase [Malacoplasma sp.]